MSPQVAITGELSLSGKLWLVGGVPEKLDASNRRWLDGVIIPKENESEAEELPAVGTGRRMHYTAVNKMEVCEDL
jgi:ATP-dependent Lon protease